MKRGPGIGRGALGCLLLCSTLAGATIVQTRARGAESPSATGAETTLLPEGTLTRERGAALGVEGSKATLEALRSVGSAVLPGPVDPDIYRIGPGDVLQLLLWGNVSRSILLEVGPEGVLVIPGAGFVAVSGRTLSEVRAGILKRMGGQFRGVNMDLRLARARSFLVYITGEVNAPGPIQASGASRVGDVLGLGMLKENASQRSIEVLHQDGTREYADLDLFLGAGDASANPRLRDGDIIHVPVVTEFIYANGALARPGRFGLGRCDSLLTLLRLAGDPLPASDADRALLVRWNGPFDPESLWLRLDDIYTRASNPELRDGDRLYVYFIPRYHLQHEATILGEVQRPGVYPIVEGRDRLSTLAQAAGGFLPGADLWAVLLKRANPRAGERDPELDRLLRLSRDQLTNSEYEVLRTKLAGLREEYRVDWYRVLKEGPPLDLLLRDGDIVVVERLVPSIRVDGEVKRPGIVQFEPRRDLQDYVNEAGGYTDRAWRGKVRVTRAVTGQTLLARNVRALGPGDFVWVPERPDVTAWEQTRDVLSALGQVATVIIAIRAVR